MTMKVSKAPLWLDQYGRLHRTDGRKGLRHDFPGAISKMYVDKNNGAGTVHIGYVVGTLWFTALTWVEQNA